MNSGFKFSLQEEKLNNLKKFATLNINSAIGNTLNRSNSYNEENSKSYLGFIKDPRYDPIIEGLKEEILVLKEYIERINREVRKNMNLEIPQIFNTKESDVDSETLSKLFDEFLGRLINPDYLHPIFSIYDKYIHDLESEVLLLKATCTKYETTITELTKENSNVREELAVKQCEMKEMLRLKVEGNNRLIPLDIEYVNALEERLNLLSKENEILSINLQKVSRDSFEYNTATFDKYKEYTKKTQLYDIVNDRLERITLALDSAVVQNRINENTIISLTNSNSKLEIEKENLRVQSQNFRLENSSLKEANIFYKNYLNN